MGMVFWVFGIVFVKTSILIEWVRIFAPIRTQHLFSLSCKILLWFTIFFYGTTIIVLFLTCLPIQRIWDKTVPGTCIDLKKVNLGIAIINVFLNTAILGLPQKIIWTLQVSTAQKLGLSAMFAVGLAYVSNSVTLGREGTNTNFQQGLHQFHRSTRSGSWMDSFR